MLTLFSFVSPAFDPTMAKKEPFHWRNIARLEVRDQLPLDSNGVTFGWMEELRARVVCR